MSNLRTRVISGAVMLALVFAGIWVRGPLLMVLVALATVLAAHEFYTICRAAGYLPVYPAGVALAVVMAMRGYLGGDIVAAEVAPAKGAAPEVMAIALVLAVVLAAVGWTQLRAWAPGRAAVTVGSAPGGSPRSPYLAWADIGLTMAGALYTGGLLGLAPLLGAIPERGETAGGVAWLALVVLGTSACDSGAYFVGSAFGRRKLIPHISPGKTWEGLVGGVLGAELAAFALARWLGINNFEALVLGLLICAAAVTGDLCESLLKRAAGVKDSGHLIPGHGGMLDRLDSILFVLVAVFTFSQVMGVS